MEQSAAQASGLSRRLCALAYDLLALLAIWFCLALSAVTLNGGESVPPWLMQLLVCSSGAGFFLVFWRHGGQTIGMLAWRLQLVDSNGGTVQPRQLLIRLLVAPFALGLFGIGYLWMLMDARRRTWHDIASGTRIVLLPRERNWV